MHDSMQQLVININKYFDHPVVWTWWHSNLYWLLEQISLASLKCLWWTVMFICSGCYTYTVLLRIICVKRRFSHAIIVEQTGAFCINIVIVSYGIYSILGRCTCVLKMYSIKYWKGQVVFTQSNACSIRRHPQNTSSEI